MLTRLQETLASQNRRAPLAKEIIEMERALLGEEVKLETMKRNDENGALRTKIFLQENEVWRRKGEIQEKKQELALIEKEEDTTWREVMGGKKRQSKGGKKKRNPKIIMGKRKRGDNEEGEEQEEEKGERRGQRVAVEEKQRHRIRSIHLVLLRFDKWMARLYRKHRLKLKAANLLAKTWKVQLEEIKQKAVLTIQVRKKCFHLQPLHLCSLHSYIAFCFFSFRPSIAPLESLDTSFVLFPLFGKCALSVLSNFHQNELPSLSLLPLAPLFRSHKPTHVSFLSVPSVQGKLHALPRRKRTRSWKSNAPKDERGGERTPSVTQRSANGRRETPRHTKIVWRKRHA